MAVFAQLAAIIVLAQALIYCGIFFMSGMLFRDTLAPVYAAVNYTGRLFIALFVAFLVGNILMSYVFRVYPPAYTAPFTLFTVVVLQVVFAVCCYGLKPTPAVFAATAAVAASCVWLSLVLNQAPPGP